MHALTERENGFVEMAFTGSRTKVWHGLGNELDANASIDTWKKQAGLDWEVFQSAATYQSIKGTHTFPEKRVLFRSDSQAPLSIVSESYKVVQPGEVLEFFRDLTEKNGMKLSTAGSLFGGKKFWALAETGMSANIVKDDGIRAHLLLTTSVDGTSKTVAKFVSERVVCNNTLTVAMNETGNKMFKKSHRSTFDPTEAKIDLGLLDSGWNNFITNLQKLARVEVSTSLARKIFEDEFYNPSISAEDQKWGALRKVDTMMGLFENGVGSQYSKGTAWGVLNAVTEAMTHGTGKRDQSYQFWDSYCDGGDSVKSGMYDRLVKMYA